MEFQFTNSHSILKLFLCECTDRETDEAMKFWCSQDGS
jgi:hypothetical protein